MGPNDPLGVSTPSQAAGALRVCAVLPAFCGASLARRLLTPGSLPRGVNGLTRHPIPRRGRGAESS